MQAVELDTPQRVYCRCHADLESGLARGGSLGPERRHPDEWLLLDTRILNDWPNEEIGLVFEKSVTATIQKETRADAWRALRIRSEAILHQCTSHYSPEVLEVWADAKLSEGFVRQVGDHFYVATVDDRIVGTGMVNLESGKVDAVLVDPGCMGRGIGKQLLGHLESLARSEGLERLKLESTLNAVRFYRSVGFVGDRISRYDSPSGVSLDCVSMVKSIVS
ncbi:MAG: GNAT family N-acetyltransferase [Myxococcota bacterium]